MRKTSLLIMIIILSSCWLAYGLEKPTHMSINDEIGKRQFNGFSLDTYLISQLGCANGVKENFNGKQVLNWLAEGGKTEDEPDGFLVTFLNKGRSNNHFHNPLKTWDKAGLDVLGYSGQSSILWAQNANQNSGGKWSWPDARKYFYAGLTAIDRSARDGAFARTFKSLGQLMHLIQDASVPAHVRNDVHIFYNYEKWLEKMRISNKEEEKRKFNDFIAEPISLDLSLLNISPNPLAPIPIARIVDTDRYNGANPDITITSPVGIAEYTNANFFSEDTIFSSEFPYPALSSAEMADYSIPDPRDENQMATRQYYLKKNRDGDSGYRLAAVMFLQDYVYEYLPDYSGSKRYSLDGEVYNDYAKKLLPRALGYSAGLLQYFFRGNLQVMAVPIFYKGSLSFMKLKIKNMTPEESMKNGSLALTYRYTPKGGAADGSEDVFGQAWGLDGSAVVPCTELKEGDTMEIDFMIYPAIAKKDYDSIRFMLAFQGTLGNEVGAVVGKAFSPGEVVFSEEWDNGLTGNHAWGHTGLNLDNQNQDNGSTGNVIVGNILIKDNIRFQDEGEARVNESAVDTLCCNGRFKDILPIPVTPNTYLMYKIDALSINQIPPAPPGMTYQWQGLWLYFNQGLVLQISQEDQMVYWNPTTAYYTFPLGVVILDNIYKLFQGWGVAVPEGPFYLQGIDFLQQLSRLGAVPSSVEHRQHMAVDFIQIIEGKEQ